MDNILGIFSFILKIIIFSLVIFAICEIISFALWFLYYRVIKQMEMPPNLSEYKKTSIFKRLLYEFPKQFWLDRFNRTPGAFEEYGLHLVCGEQGSGKTTSVVDLLLNRWVKKYPRLKIYTNLDYKHEDGVISHWKDLLSKDRQNGVFRRC